MKGLFGLESFGVQDEFFFMDHDKNRANIITCMKLEKYEYEEFRAALISKARTKPRCSSIIVK
eukprot:CAMPEP_0116872382 /NCGR_PEP_ID=MMETSP0463-20121206/3125_1 /TAXON_ID=181622 /ORGANISM="Strombidinopsis sp, Strain SopsisLIS2011" /LENGTH=62 /DNA_ID=CAMNT_0004512533 /DNA_START=117 /DNA_END=305 /DNA_ORIENTATION=+